MKQKREILHFGYVTQWEIFCRVVFTNQVLCYDDPSIPRHFFMYPLFTVVDYGPVWLLIRGNINQLCGQTATDLRMGAPLPTTNFARLPVILTETQRKDAINSPMQSSRFPRELEEWLEAQPQRFVLLGIVADSYDAVIWAITQFCGPLNSWWLNRRQHATILFTYPSVGLLMDTYVR
jgi:hypothetical protein